ncbi:hypothetical protein CNMCM8980_004165 [Aspergillus fumigatiaffinis]|jgi:hypothetical protein|uniref:Coiled-coil domain-containing protein n=1 Tax=Aspergillus fumigatiaffinis TaxID=340414 RepID=A0A8H4H1J9_9EURO|nr:hypothetical protein CNMCM5878_007689 [Aspergillus fumigatiaffinis]KAF4233708.1 hypothetical protein CNMCM6457_004341 [Aspergillus fumigatiaffinis]KAF4239521.1 hypothetical protein CNMCM6805_005732 [Aspergillus fumigatiaffinis]KAF4249209.1 hypothetical protein CNMCM8980_004165 [Aspergillus fumigatiaffinis]
MSNTNPSLYGLPRHTQKPSSQSTAPSASTLAFTTQLSSLITKGTESSARGRPRPSKSSKSDIFAVHNKGAQKRAAADLRDADDDNDETSVRQIHKRTADIGAVDTATLHRSKRRLEEKARMYEDLKSGLYLAGDSDDEEIISRDDYLARLRRKEKEGLVDFDRKWAETQRARGSDDSEEEEAEADDNASIVSYEDELGRTRRGTRAEAARAALAKAQESGEGRGPERWKPARPENLIYGPAVQAEAFNLSSSAAEQMASLAARRDRSPTPPEETHYDADAEVRNRGTAFYAFAKDEETRRKQMEELMSAREETQREREARQARRAERQRVKDERRRQIEELRTKRRAETFLAGLGDLGALQADAS